jgi:NAD(P)-dependent dehydrogenase (short-subunit alcohol dehydrogenase family)
LAARGAAIVLVGRSPEKYRDVLAGLEDDGADHKLVAADFRDLASVAAAARWIAEVGPGAGRQDLIVVNNAATAGTRGVTVDGFELAFGVNYVAHYLLTSLLLRAALPISRVINLTSNAHYSTARLDLDLAMGKTRSLSGWKEYAHSKAAMAAFSLELAERVPTIDALAVHPGVVATGLWRRIPQPFRALATRRMVSPEVGAIPLVRAATDAGLRSGAYLDPDGLQTPSPAVLDPTARRSLWDATERWVESFR